MDSKKQKVIVYFLQFFCSWNKLTVKFYLQMDDSRIVAFVKFLFLLPHSTFSFPNLIVVTLFRCFLFNTTLFFKTMTTFEFRLPYFQPVSSFFHCEKLAYGSIHGNRNAQTNKPPWIFYLHWKFSLTHV